MDYVEIQKLHYDKIAQEFGDSELSTMQDIRVREIETIAIVNAIETALKLSKANEIRILDAGCGNGTTLKYLSKFYDQNSRVKLYGLEFNEKLLEIAKKNNTAEIQYGDLKTASTLPSKPFDVIILQRVIINIMDPDDQELAINNVLNILKYDGLLLTIEAYNQGFELMNKVREEVGLERVQMPHHNLYLDDSFFNFRKLVPLYDVEEDAILSAHYFASYVLYPALAKANGVQFRRNSSFLYILSNMLKGFGGFGSNKIKMFKKLEK